MKKIINRKTIQRLFVLIVVLLIISISAITADRVEEKIESEKANVKLREVFLTTSVKKVNEHKLKKEMEAEIAQAKESNLYNNIQAVIDKYSTTDAISISFHDFYSNKYIGYNDKKEYLGASTTKVPLAMLICQKISRGELSWDTTMTYSASDYEGGTGVMFRDIKEGQAFTVKTMLYNMIVHSDNIATNMFYRHLGYSNSKAEMGRMINTNIVTTGNIITTEQMNKFFKLLYEKRNDNHFSYLVDILNETVFHDRLDKYLPYDIVAHKIGNYGGNTHDCGIIFGPRPYALTVYTNGVSGGTEKIAQISKEIYECYINSGV